MNSNVTKKKKYKPSNNKTLSTTNPETSVERNNGENGPMKLELQCPLLAKDSEWVDILHKTSIESKCNSGEEAVLQLVEREGSETKPLVQMFPDLLDEDPEMIEGMLSKAMSTSEVTKHLVGHKANFSFMKKVNRLIPSDKKWLERLSENSNSLCSILSALENDSVKSDYEADVEDTDNEIENENEETKQHKKNVEE